MWWTVIFTLATLGTVKSFREVRPVGVNPSPVSNIELLIPVAVSQVEDVEVDRDVSDEDEKRDRDERYSAIPAYAFTLDDDPISTAERELISSKYHRQKPELIPSHSWYLSSKGQRPQDQGRNEQEPHMRSEIRLREEKRNGCLALANQHSADAREVLLYLCTELVDVLTSRCDCCEELQRAKKSTTTFKFLGKRHSNKNVPDDDDRYNRLGRRVFV